MVFQSFIYVQTDCIRRMHPITIFLEKIEYFVITKVLIAGAKAIITHKLFELKHHGWWPIDNRIGIIKHRKFDFYQKSWYAGAMAYTKGPNNIYLRWPVNVAYLGLNMFPGGKAPECYAYKH